ncbi:MAG: hypothetical protein LBS53_01280 [Synergistaceae bacterium]|jgi:chromosomal replication initiation ATPase DnaA|nr:hypothetical protein [Synergistaceae bacterium]
MLCAIFTKPTNRSIISSDIPPKDIEGILKHLVSGFTRGLVVGIQLPDPETMVAILVKRPR